MTMHEGWNEVSHEEWTAKLSEYLDDELSNEDRNAVDGHLRGCPDCTTVLNELKGVVARAQAAAPHPPQAALWAGIAERLEADVACWPAQVMPVATRQPRRITFTLPQLAAAAVLLAAVSSGLAWRLADRSGTASRPIGSEPVSAIATLERDLSGERTGAPGDARVEMVGLADPQYDAAVADLEKALKDGRGRLDASTIAIVEHNLQIIDQAIAQAREALVGDPANSYLSGHLVEARRRKLDLLRRATALASETN
jgi:hypothetical protein